MKNISHAGGIGAIAILLVAFLSLVVFSQGVQTQAPPSSSLGQSCSDDSRCEGDGERCDYEKNRCVCRSGFHANLAKTHCITVESYGGEVCDMRFPGSLFNTDRKRCECPAGTRKGSDGRSCIGTPLASSEGALKQRQAAVSISIIPADEAQGEKSVLQKQSLTQLKTSPAGSSSPLQNLEHAAASARQTRTGGQELQPSTKREFTPSLLLYVLLALLAGAGAWWFFRKSSRSAGAGRSSSKTSARGMSAKKSIAGAFGKAVRVSALRGAPYAGFWIRVGALILDYVILGIPSGIVFAAVFLSSPLLSPLVGIGLGVLVLYLEGVKGGTPGKLIIGLRIVTEQGSAIGIPRALLRNIGKALSGMVFGIGFLMIGWTAKKQGLHDLIAGSVVVSTR